MNFLPIFQFFAQFPETDFQRDNLLSRVVDMYCAFKGALVFLTYPSTTLSISFIILRSIFISRDSQWPGEIPPPRQARQTLALLVNRATGHA
jgi:hypothetical protein